MKLRFVSVLVTLCLAFVCVAQAQESAKDPKTTSQAQKKPAAKKAHAAHTPTEKPAEKPAEKVLKAPGEAGIGDLTTCLVTDERFTVEKDSGRAEHNGKTYYFCCDGCADDFRKDPESSWHISKSTSTSDAHCRF